MPRFLTFFEYFQLQHFRQQPYPIRQLRLMWPPGLFRPLLNQFRFVIDSLPATGVADRRVYSWTAMTDSYLRSPPVHLKLFHFLSIFVPFPSCRQDEGNDVNMKSFLFFNRLDGMMTSQILLNETHTRE